jgi:hypothetical protein
MDLNHLDKTQLIELILKLQANIEKSKIKETDLFNENDHLNNHRTTPTTLENQNQNQTIHSLVGQKRDLSGEIKNSESSSTSKISSTNENENTKNDIEIQNKTGKQKKTRLMREFDIGKYSIRHIAFKLSYFGWQHEGFAAQTDTENTIEEHLWKVLTKTFLISDRKEAEQHFSKCGRTDKGVSAIDQVKQACHKKKRN